MPSHRNALKKLLASVEERIHKDEARLPSVIDDEERRQLIEEIADLHLQQHELKAALLGDGD
jgi:hypothetical protein